MLAISISKAAGFITYRDFNTDEARKWFPISLLLIGMIYTSAKALQFLSVPVYTIFKNLTIILIAYGEVLWFGGSVTGTALFSFGLMVLSSVVAAWADIQSALQSYGGGTMSGEAAEAISTLNAGYLWMLFNCFCSAAFVLGMRKRIKLTNFKDFDSMSLFAASRSLSTANKLSQRCSITTSSPSPSFSSAHYSWRTGPAPISPSTFPKANAPTTPAPCYSPVSPRSSSPTGRHGVSA